MTHLFSVLTLPAFFCILRQNIFKGGAQSSVFFIENGGSLKTCWKNKARFYFSARTQQVFLAADFHFHTGCSVQFLTGARNTESWTCATFHTIDARKLCKKRDRVIPAIYRSHTLAKLTATPLQISSQRSLNAVSTQSQRSRSAFAAQSQRSLSAVSIESQSMANPL